ncbi:MAG: hypothetical protein HY650_11320, partial [Acidobacteria bacterium]|nr:hypothetical protein [Acidobacteriota bacterium]
MNFESSSWWKHAAAASVTLSCLALGLTGFSASSIQPLAGTGGLWEIPDQVVDQVSGERAKAHVIELSRYYREDATPGFHEAATYILETAGKYGLHDAHIETFPVDGKIRNFNLQSRYGWNPKRAELWLSDPLQKLADFQETSTHLATWSVSANVEAELVDVGIGTSPTDFEGKDVRGKLVFTSSTPSAVQAEAVGRRGAAGIVSWWSPPSRQSFPDQVHWLDTANNREERKSFAFVLSRRQGLALKERLSRGSIRVRAVVEAELGPGNLEVVS